jgi:hypothetical protein
MKPAVLACLALAILVLCAAPAHAAQPSPATATPSLDQLHAAIFSPDAPDAQQQPIEAAVLHCSPPPAGCAYPACVCEYFTCSKCGVASFTCNPSTLKSTCKCKIC